MKCDSSGKLSHELSTQLRPPGKGFHAGMKAGKAGKSKEEVIVELIIIQK